MENILAAAIKDQKLGKFKEALELYKKILQSNPNHLPSLILTGKLYLKVKKPEVALMFFEHANRISPNNPEIINGIGKALISQEKLNDARLLFEDLIKDHTEYVPAILNLAKINKVESKYDEAIVLYERALGLNSDSLVALNNLGNLFQQRGEINKSKECFLKAIQLYPENAQLRMNYGNILFLENKLEDSFEEYKKALIFNPKLIQVYKNLCELYTKLFSYEKALFEIERIYKSGVKLPEILLTGAILAIKNNDFKLAINMLLKNHELFPDHFETLYQLGISYHQSAYFNKTIKVYEKAYKIDDKSDVLLYAMAKVYSDLKQPEKSFEFLKKAIEINPDNFTVQHEFIRNRLNVCDWTMRSEDERFLEEISLKQIDLVSPSPIPFLNLNYFKQENSFLLECSKHSALNSKIKIENYKKEIDFKHKKDLKNKIRIGYISPDFRDHPTGRVVVDFITSHHKEDFEIFCFSLIADLPKDQIQKKFKESCDHFISLYNVSIVAAAKTIFENNIDILIDIAGYTTYSRPEILALQPAPIQCQMIGFPGTMGASFIQYIIADDVLIPKEHEDFYTEKMVRLPFGFPGSVLDVNTQNNLRANFGLPDDKIIYCCFNSQYKYSPDLYDVWMDILRDVPDSILLLKGGDDIYQKNICRETMQRNVDESRIYFADNLPFADYMARNGVCDLFLDTFYYTAGSTAINALQVGLPVLTLCGKTNASRMAASIVKATPLNSFIVNSVAEYKEKAVYYGNHKDELNQIKKNVKEEILNCDLFNSKKFVSNLEKAFVVMWENYTTDNVIENISVE